MSHQGVLSAKQQEAAFGQILKKQFNSRCADCSSKSPTWASLDFGVFVCYNCSGAHRMLGMNVTRIRSTKLDCWTQENIDMMDALGNDLNDYWENRIPKNSKITPSATPEEIRAFVQEKYVKRAWVKQGQADPKTRYNQCLLSGVPFRVNQNNTFFSENGTQQQPVKDSVKQFHSTQVQQQWGFERKERQHSVDNRQKDVNLLSPDKGLEFDWATATNHFNTVSGVPFKQEINIKTHENNSAHQLSTGTSPLFKPKQNNLQDFDLLGQSIQPAPLQPVQQQPPLPQKVPTSQQFNTYNPSNQIAFCAQQTQKPQAQQFNSYNPSAMNDFSFPQSQASKDFSSFGFPQNQQWPQQQTVPQQQLPVPQLPTSKPPLPGKPNPQYTQITQQQQYQSYTNQQQQAPQQFNSNPFQTQKYQNNPFVKDMQDIMNLYSTQQPNKYDHLRNNPFM